MKTERYLSGVGLLENALDRYIREFGKDGCRCVNDIVDLLGRMRRAEEEAQPGGFLRYAGRQDRKRIEPGRQETLGKDQGAHGLPDNDRDDPVAPGFAGIEALGLGALEETLGIGGETRDAVRLGIHQFQRLGRGRGDAGRHPDAVDEARRVVLEQIHRHGIARDITTATDEAFRQGAEPEIDPGRIDILVFEEPLACLAENAEAMGIVDHQPAAMLLLEFDEAGEVRPVAIHREEPFGNDHGAAETATLGREERLERVEIVMREIAPRRARELGADHDAIMDQRIMDDEVLRAEKGRDGRDAGGMAGIEGDAILGGVIAGQQRLEVAMRLTFPGADPAGRDRAAIGRQRRFPRGADFRVPVQAEIIVGGEIDHLAIADHRSIAGAPAMKAIIGNIQRAELGEFALELDLLVLRQRFEPDIVSRHGRRGGGLARGRRRHLAHHAQKPVEIAALAAHVLRPAFPMVSPTPLARASSTTPSSLPCMTAIDLARSI